jgi:hypothetical protein
MARVLSKLCIDEVSAVTRGAGEDCRIVLMKRAYGPDATPADTLRAFPNPKRGRSFNDVMKDEADASGEDVTKAEEPRGHHDLAGALVRHLHDRLTRRREAHGFTKTAKEQPIMDTVHSIMKDCGGPVAFAKTICDTGRSYGVSESEFVDSAGRHASELYGLPGDRAFAKLCESDGSA